MAGSSGVAFLNKLVESYLEGTSDFVSAMKAAVERGDHDVVRKAAHSVKSSSLSLGALRLSEQCRDLEKSCRDGRPIDIETKVGAIAASYEEAALLLQSELNRMNAEFAGV